MTAVLSARTSGAEDRRALAGARLVDEFDRLWQRLISLARFRYRLAREDCEEIAADALLAWYQELCRQGEVRIDAAYLVAVLHHSALDHKKALRREKRAAVETVPLAAVDCGGVDPKLDVLVAEREELHDLAELANDVLSERELEIVLLSRQGVPRADIGARYGLSVRSVERCLDRAQRKLDEGIAAMSARGRCGMLALTISDIKTGYQDRLHRPRPSAVRARDRASEALPLLSREHAHRNAAGRLTRRVMSEPGTTTAIADPGGLDPALLAGIVQRASASGFDRFRSQLRSSGYCARPVRVHGEICDQNGHRVWSTDTEPDGVLRVACGNRREAVCPSCAERYRQDAYHLIGAGMRGGKGVPASVSAHPFVFATLTAPSFGHVHTRPLDRNGTPRRCRPRRDAPVCPHGVRLSCGQVHAEDDQCLGQPLCAECFDHEAAVIWNNTLGELWRRTTVYLPRHLAAVLGITQKRLRGLARIAYVKVPEYRRADWCTCTS